MTRYFYTDPLAAAWMVKHFAMKLEGRVIEHDEPVEFERFTCTAPSYGTLWGHVVTAAQDESQRFYIHPDSLHLLRPRLGDIVELADGVLRFKWDGDLVERLNPRVIQRDGMAFHWPEVEP